MSELCSRLCLHPAASWQLKLFFSIVILKIANHIFKQVHSFETLESLFRVLENIDFVD